MTRLFTAAAAAALLVGAPGLASAQTPTSSTGAVAQAAPAAAGSQIAPQGDLLDTLKLSGKFTTFTKGIDATNLAGLIKTNKNLTVFAPTDAAFASIPAAELSALMADKAALQKFVLHHVVNAPVDSAKIKGAKGPVPSGAGDQILLDGSDEAGVLKVDGATIVQADIRTGSGLLHVVDKVLVAGQGAADPPAAAAPGADAAASTPAKPASAEGTNTTPKS
jgi:uncharacterized surface protein with fasciclin (FAS1) repeats